MSNVRSLLMLSGSASLGHVHAETAESHLKSTEANGDEKSCSKSVIVVAFHEQWLTVVLYRVSRASSNY